MSRRPIFSRRNKLGAVLCTALLGLSCGRKATEADCEAIVKRVAELELAAIAPGQDVAEEVISTQKALREQTLKNCVGRRISENALDCIENAKSASALIDDCFD